MTSSAVRRATPIARRTAARVIRKRAELNVRSPGSSISRALGAAVGASGDVTGRA
jgi:hypothetical protein